MVWAITKLRQALDDNGTYVIFRHPQRMFHCFKSHAMTLDISCNIGIVVAVSTDMVTIFSIERDEFLHRFHIDLGNLLGNVALPGHYNITAYRLGSKNTSTPESINKMTFENGNDSYFETMNKEGYHDNEDVDRDRYSNKCSDIEYVDDLKTLTECKHVSVSDDGYILVNVRLLVQSIGTEINSYLCVYSHTVLCHRWFAAIMERICYSLYIDRL